MKKMMMALGCAAVALAVLALLAALSIVLDIPGGKRFRCYCSYSDMKALMVGEKDDITSTLDCDRDGTNYTLVALKPCMYPRAGAGRPCIWSRRSPVRRDRRRRRRRALSAGMAASVELVNVITGDVVRPKKKSPNEGSSNHRTKPCQITEQNHVKSPNVIDLRLQEVIKYAA